MRAEHNAGAEVGLWLMTHHQRAVHGAGAEGARRQVTKFQFKLNFNC